MLSHVTKQWLLHIQPCPKWQRTGKEVIPLKTETSQGYMLPPLIFFSFLFFLFFLSLFFKKVTLPKASENTFLRSAVKGGDAERGGTKRRYV